MNQIKPDIILIAAILILLFGSAPVWAHRELLYPANIDEASPQLREIIKNIINPDAEPRPYSALTKTGKYFVRINNRKHTIPENQILETAKLAGTDFVFLTVPETFYGNLPLEYLLFDIGYDLQEISKEAGEEKVAIVFRYSPDITFSSIVNGELPTDWGKHVYKSTWKNIFTIFSKLAQENKLGLNEGERNLVLSFNPEGQKRIIKTPYDEIKADGGDWPYRELLEKKFNILKHFTGNGLTHNELLDPEFKRPDVGIPEFIGPKREIKQLAKEELAIISLGKVTVAENDASALRQNLKSRPER